MNTKVFDLTETSKALVIFRVLLLFFYVDHICFEPLLFFYVDHIFFEPLLFFYVDHICFEPLLFFLVDNNISFEAIFLSSEIDQNMLQDTRYHISIIQP